MIQILLASGYGQVQIMAVRISVSQSEIKENIRKKCLEPWLGWPWSW